ncbi:major facilitator superfamily domain-containing protein 6-like isoform X2 [Procambarus clarkii]|uniref:major facilitator superfamily domain-containing protein 6 isoform X2 n=1 Tax=Procambarus clarkii TaxID=6728 RepID=UPI001E6720FF|nr:major facilitator superfamily domain-containing protein 6-like isoform X2 [Procambarus clarkii]
MPVTINKGLLPLKIHYFLKYGGMSFFTFLPVVARQKGIPTLAVGLMWTVTPLSSCAINIMMSTLADAFKIHRALFLAGMVTLSTSFLSIFLLPDISRSSHTQTEATVSLHCLDNITRLSLCSKVNENYNAFSLSVFQKCAESNTSDKLAKTEEDVINCMVNCTYPQDVTLNENLLMPSDLIFNLSEKQSVFNVCENDTCAIITGANASPLLSQFSNFTCGEMYDATCLYHCGSVDSRDEKGITLSDVIPTAEFWLIFILLVLLYGGNATTTTMADTVCFSLLGNARHKYGRQRMWGSVGWGSVGTVSGALVDYYSKGRAHINYTPALIISGIFLTLNLIVSLQIKFSFSKKDKLIARNVGNLICTPKMMIYMLTVIVVGLSMGTMWTFLFIIVEDVALAWDPFFPHMKLLQGLMLGAECFLGEVPFLFLSSLIIKKMGKIPTFALSLTAFSLRLLLYSSVTNPWYFLPVDLLHGLSFGLFYPNMISYASSVAPRGAQATVQGIIKSIFIGGVSSGAMVGGLLVKTVGGSRAYLYMGLFDVAFTLFFIIIQFLIYKISSRKSQDEDEDSAPEEGQVLENGIRKTLYECDAEGQRSICDLQT